VNVRLRSVISEKFFWCIPGVNLIYFAQPLFLGKTFFFRDLYLHFLPVKSLMVDLVYAGSYMDPYRNGSEPFFSNMNNIPLYPTNLLYFVLPLMTALNIDIVLHLILCGMAVYVLARTLDFDPLASFLAASVYEFSGITLSLLNVWMLAPVHFPALLLFWHLYLVRKQAKWFVCAVVIGVLQVLAGRPEMSIISLPFLIVWTLLFGYQHSFRSVMSRWFLLVFLIAGISAIQLLPMADLVTQSSRKRTYVSFTTWSVNPKRLPELVLPNFLGRTDTLSAADYYGRTIEDRHFPYLLSIYFGFTSLCLAVYGAVRSNPTAVNNRERFWRALAALAALFVLFSLGRYLPYFKAIYGIPFISLFRYPVKALIVAVLPITLLAARGICLFRENPCGRKFNIGLLGPTIFMIALSLVFYFSHSFSKSFCHFFFGSEETFIVERTAKVLWYSCAVLICSFSASFLPNLMATYILVVIVLADLLFAGCFVNPVAERRVFTSKPATVSLVQSILHGGRLYREPEKKIPVLQAPSNRVEWQYRWNLETLNLHLGTYFKIPTIFYSSLDSLNSARMAKLTETINALPWNRRLPMISAGGARCLITETKVEAAGLQMVATLYNRSNIRFFIYRNEMVVEDPTFYTGGVVVSNQDQAMQAMQSSQFDPRKYVVLENAQAAQSCNLAPGTTIRPLGDQHWNVESGCAGYLVFLRPYYRGYKVTVDGNNAEIVRANVAFFGIYVPAGKHRIELSFMPRSFILGALISLSSTIVLIGLVYLRQL
jgi:hypothetical protein